jgi:ribosomal protein S18 acetylase RimI-like enzyme
MMHIMMTLLTLLLVLATTPATSFQFSPRLTSRHYPELGHATATDDDATDHNLNLIDTKDFFIEKVSTKARALDVRVFRGFSISAEEYISEQHSVGNTVSEFMAVDHLMQNYDEQGHYITKNNNNNNNLVQNEPEDYFIALYNGTDTQYDLSMARQNGLAGLVRTQLRRQPPLIVGPSSDGTPSILVLPPTVTIPSSHLYVANMRVGDTMQRRGIGMALLSSIKDYVDTLGEDRNIPLVLSVDSDNLGAIQLYEKFGFEYLERNSDWGTMILI